MNLGEIVVSQTVETRAHDPEWPLRAYACRQLHRGRPAGDVVDDPYLVNRAPRRVRLRIVCWAEAHHR
ncbi:MAG: hypothetical protein MUE51_04030 [Thermoleophilia bacterium]|jgi:hypothetical protein|nr:hypothetical protein [Thermoleophilia bacterium]